LAGESEAEILDLLEQGEKLQAVKLHRNRTGADLMTAKRAVESIADRHGVAVNANGCSGVAVIVAMAIAVAMAGLIALLALQD